MNDDARQSGGLRPEEIELLLSELVPALIGSRIDKVVDAGPDAFVLRIEGRSGRFDLLVSTQPGMTRFHLVEPREASPRPTEHAIQLRQLLRGLKITEIDQPGGDRILRIRGERRHGEGMVQRTLVLELFGPRGRLVVFESVERTIKFVRGRPGLRLSDRYRFPDSAPKRKAAPRPFDPVKLISWERRDDPLAFNRTLAEQMVGEAARNEVETLRRTAGKLARSEHKRTSRLQVQLASDLEKSLSWERQQQFGELLKASLHQVESGASVATVQDWYSEDTPLVDIELDVTKSPAENADAYFRRARKRRRGVEQLTQRLEDCEAKLEKLQQVLDQLEAATELQEVQRAAATLEAMGIRARPQQEPGVKKKKAPRKGIRKYRSRQGLEILVGVSARDNDRLSIHVARGNDLFFHRADRPGPHVVLRVPAGKTASPESLEDAAFLAGYMGGWRGPAATMVHWTPAKFVRKPKGFPPGKVLVARSREFLVRYRPELLDQLTRSDP